MLARLCRIALPICVVNGLHGKFRILKPEREAQKVDEPADDERAVKLAQLHSLHPEFFPLGVRFKNLPIREGDCWRRSNHVRLTGVGGNAKLRSLTSRRVNIDVVAER